MTQIPTPTNGKDLKISFEETNGFNRNYKVWEPCNIWDSQIGDNTQIGAFCDIGKAVIGKRCRIGSGVIIPEGVIIQNDVFVGMGTVFCNDFHPSVQKALEGNFQPETTIVKSRANIGANCTILPGIIIGKGATIGAGSVVTKDVKDFQIVCGNPAKPTKNLRKK